MSNLKQVIVMRTDLNMRKGKMIAQGSHASSKVVFDLMKKDNHTWILDINNPNGKNIEQWVLEAHYKKVCVGIPNEQELLDIAKKAETLNIPCCVITDNGVTEFNGVKTITCLALGPYNSDLIDTLTGNLKLL